MLHRDNMTQETDLAWLAGIIDGEGSVQITKCKRNYKTGSSWFVYTFRIHIYNTDNLIIKKASEILQNNSISFRIYIKKDFKITQWNKKTYYYIQIQRKQDLKNILEKIIPYLIKYEKKAKLLFELMNRRMNKKREHYNQEEIFLINQIRESQNHNRL